MTNAQARAEAKRRWGNPGFARVRVQTFGPAHLAVGCGEETYGLSSYGFAASWEDAFRLAEAKPKESSR